MEAIEVIYAREKHDDRIVRAEDGTLSGAALVLLEERYLDDWYEEDDREEASEIVGLEDGTAAWRFLRKRIDYEYEYVEARTI